MDERSSDKGWHSENTGHFRDDRGSGAGAVTGRGAPRPAEPGAGEYGGGRGTDYEFPPKREPAEEAEARQGPIPSEVMPEGWGGPGENYATAQGPNDRDDEEAHQDKEFWEGPPPAGAD